MKRFRFRLQTLLDRRLAVEQELTRELGTIMAEEQHEIYQLHMLQTRSSEAFQLLSKQLSKPCIDPVEIGRIDEFARGTLEDIETQQAVVEEVHRRVLAKQDQVIEAMKARKVLEALRDKQLAAYNLAVQKAEQAELDEISSLRYVRGM